MRRVIKKYKPKKLKRIEEDPSTVDFASEYRSFSVNDVSENDIQIEIDVEKQVAKKLDSEKPDMALLSAVAVVKIAEVMTFGKKKYAAHNWRSGLAWSRVIAALLRHVFAYLGGEDKDPESGFSHLAHAGCCIMFLLEFETTKPELDDRYKT